MKYNEHVTYTKYFFKRFSKENNYWCYYVALKAAMFHTDNEAELMNLRYDLWRLVEHVDILTD